MLGRHGGADIGRISGAVFQFSDPDAPPGSKEFMSGTWNFSDRPKVVYEWDNRNLFYREGQLKSALISKTADVKNCLQYHKGPDEKKVGWVHRPEFDAHYKAGLRCTDCHDLVENTPYGRMEHQIAKGWHPLGSVRDDLDGVDMKTCRACHLEKKYRPTRPGMPETAKNPTKKHEEKSPDVAFHFNRISCANCHSTGQPGMSGYLLDMGPGGQIWYTAATLEAITWPDDFGKLAPAPWKPWITLFDALPSRTVVNVRDTDGAEVKKPTVAREEEIRGMIEGLTGMGFRNVVIVSDRIYELGEGTVVSYEDDRTAHPHTFPVHHNVIPLDRGTTYGKKGKPEGCMDCHSKTSEFFTKMLIRNTGLFLLEDYPVPREPNAEPQMIPWGFREVPVPAEGEKGTLKMERTAALFILALIMAAFPGKAAAAEGGDIRELSLIEVQRKMTGGTPPVLVNTISLIECRDHRIPGSECVPVTDMADGWQGPGDRDREIVFYCKSPSCRRSLLAAETALKQGFRNAAVLAGGLPASKESGYEVLSTSLPFSGG